MASNLGQVGSETALQEAIEKVNRADLKPNAVFHMFSNDVRDFAQDLAPYYNDNVGPLTKNNCSFRMAIESAEALVILDRTPDTHAPPTGKHGQVCLAFVVLHMPEYTEKLSLDACKELRNKIEIQQLQTTLGVEIVIQPYHVFLEHSTPGLAVFDMDSTLIQQEVIDELARTVGLYDEVAKVTEAAMRGELDFEESLRARVAKLKGVHQDIWETLKKDVITITPGARSTIKVLKVLGWKTAVLSGGFTPLANWLRDELGLDYAFANHLAMDEDGTHLSGELVPDTIIVDGNAKRGLLVKIAEECKIPMKRTIAVGDGSNDLPMMNAAGFGIAFNAKPKVQETAPARLNSSSLLDILYLLGFTKEKIEQALAG